MAHSQTGTTDIPLTERGQQRILERREKAVGEGSESIRIIGKYVLELC
jgi:hypothetical protein